MLTKKGTGKWFSQFSYDVRLKANKYCFNGELTDFMYLLEQRPNEFQIVELFNSDINQREWFIWDNRKRVDSQGKILKLPTDSTALTVLPSDNNAIQ